MAEFDLLKVKVMNRYFSIIENQTTSFEILRIIIS